ncbi:MAG: hypothetical protein R3D60_12800 [Paracoccaceae bacterium]
MQLVLHIGAYGTTWQPIARWLATNRDDLRGQGLLVPTPPEFMAAIQAAMAEPPDADPLAREERLVRSLGAARDRRRIVLSIPGLAIRRHDVISPRGFYIQGVSRRLSALRRLFPRTRFTVMLSVAPASQCLPRLLSDGSAPVDALVSLGEETLPWGALVATIRQGLPDARVVIWQDADLPHVWHRVLSTFVGPERYLPAPGLASFAGLGLTREGRVRLDQRLKAEPPRRVSDILSAVSELAPDHRAPFPRTALSALPPWAARQVSCLDLGHPTEWADIQGQAGVTILD